MRQLKITQQVTNRDSLALDKYMSEVSHTEMVTPQEEVELAHRIQNGDAEALEKLVKANLRFVISVAKQYQNRGLSLLDLINEGNLGLFKAAQRFDPSRGFKFISYAVWWVRQSIQKSLTEDSRLVRLPANKINSMNKIMQTRSRLEQEYGREPSAEEVAEIAKMKEEDVNMSIRNYARTVSMDAPLSTESESGNMYDVMVDEDALSPVEELMRESLQAEIKRTLLTLPAREADVLKYYFGLGNIKEPMLVDEIARMLDVTPERVRQIKDKAIRRLRHSSKNKILKSYLG